MMAMLADVWFEWKREWWKCTTVTDGLGINKTALTLVKGDRRAQRTVYDVSKLGANELQGLRTNQRVAKREKHQL